MISIGVEAWNADPPPPPKGELPVLPVFPWPENGELWLELPWKDEKGEPPPCLLLLLLKLKEELEFWLLFPNVEVLLEKLEVFPPVVDPPVCKYLILN